MLRTLSICFLASLPAFAQEKKPAPPPAGLTITGADKEDVGAGEKSGDSGVGAAAILPPRGQCRFETATKPRRIPPGGAGTLVVVMVLEGDAVLVAPPPVTFDIRDRQGPVRLGMPQFRPAKAAVVAPAFQGREVYDNTAMIDIPVEVDVGAPFGKHVVAVGLNFDLHQGKTGSQIGRFADVARCEIEIGMPDPAVSPPSKTDRQGTAKPQVEPSNLGTPSPASTRERVGGKPVPAPGDSAAIRAAAPPPPPDQPSAPGQDPVREEQTPDAPEPSGAGTFWVLGAGACLLIALVALLLRRR